MLDINANYVNRDKKTYKILSSTSYFLVPETRQNFNIHDENRPDAHAMRELSLFVYRALGGASGLVGCSTTLFFCGGMAGKIFLNLKSKPMSATQTILTLPYKNLAISRSMKRFMNLHGFNTLEKMLEFSLADLYKIKGFTVHKFKELYDLLKSEGLESYLKAS